MDDPEKEKLRRLVASLAKTVDTLEKELNAIVCRAERDAANMKVGEDELIARTLPRDVIPRTCCVCFGELASTPTEPMEKTK